MTAESKLVYYFPLVVGRVRALADVTQPIEKVSDLSARSDGSLLRVYVFVPEYLLENRRPRGFSRV